jgi:hypothetical protein
MDKAKIQSILQARFNQNNWKQFLSKVFFNAQLLTNPELLTGINTDVAAQAFRLGSVKLNENGIERHIAVFEVTLAAGIVLERNRVGLRNLLRKYWRDIDGAFIVYHHPESPSWRFTYVSELTGFSADGEIVQVKTEPKRYTYVLGERESCKTAAQRFSMLANKGNKASLDDVKEAFSVEKLSKSFFDEYKEHYQDFVQFFTGKQLVKNEEKLLSKPNSQLAYIFNGDEKDVRDFCKKLLGRIVFLYFIQKKGWLGVPKGSEWGEGDHHFLTNLFKHCRNPQLFYQQYLSKLFFDTLNNEREGDLIELIEGQSCRIPYLNGGLFEEDDPNHRNLVFEPSLFKELFEFFNQYNFTIYEDDPNDHTVAVDPEMLGHIFENLLEDNKDKGAFYTPKEIVHYMCQESLIEYLCTLLQIKPEDLERLAVTNLIKNKEVDELLKPEIGNINNALDNVKICDPAIGSGAFPMGLLHEIFIAKQTLHTFEHGNTKTFYASAIKLNIIQNSIYGVDIEKGAVDIARLRFWLSLIVDEEKPKALPNLDYKIVVGNSLVSKLGDEIIDIDWEVKAGTQSDIFGADLAKEKAYLLKEISKEQKEFFNRGSGKNSLAADIRKLKIELLITQLKLMIQTKGIETQPSGTSKTLTKQTEVYLQTLSWKNSIRDLQILKSNTELPLQFFDWKLDFPEVLNENITSNPGFDIVIANPPYIGQKGNKSLFEVFKESGRWKFFYERKQDIYYYFIAQGILLTKEKGNLSYINPPYFISAAGAGNLREFIVKHSYIDRIMNLSESVKVFENANINSLILFLSKNSIYDNSKIKILEPNSVSSKSYLHDPKLSISKFSTADLASDVWHIFKDDKTLELNNKKTFDLGSISTISPGIQTGCDKVSQVHIDTYKLKNAKKDDGIFVLTDEEFNDLNFSQEEKKYIKPFYKNSAISKWTYKKQNKHWIIITNNINNINDYPKIKLHLTKYKIILDNRYRNFALINADKENKWWYLYGYRPNTNFNDEKIVLPYRAIDNSFAYSSEPFYASIDVFFVNVTDPKFKTKYISAILCSKLIEYWLNKNCKRKGKILELYQKPLSAIPIIYAEPKTQNQFVVNTDEILSRKKLGKDTLALEQQNNNMIYKLYDLTYDEVKVIDLEFCLTKIEYEAIKLE